MYIEMEARHLSLDMTYIRSIGKYTCTTQIHRSTHNKQICRIFFFINIFSHIGTVSFFCNNMQFLTRQLFNTKKINDA